MNRAALGILGRFFRKLTSERGESGSTTPIQNLVVDLLGSYSTTVLDIGARDSSPSAWWRLDPIASLVGFELDPTECARLNKESASPRVAKFVAMALGETNRRATLYQTKHSACASIFKPLEDLGKIYPPLEAIECIATTEIDLQRLDDWWREEECPQVSFIKLDTQGSELGILKGGLGVLGSALGCEIEVEFSPLYGGQPLFSDVDAFMRSNGFVLWQLRDPCSYSGDRWDAGLSGRLFWANAVYLRDPLEVPATEPNWNRLLILAALLEALGDKTAGRRCLNHLFESMSFRERPSANEFAEATP
jgi:FkbM family methyltransferase